MPLDSDALCLLRLVEHVHGHLGWLAAAALIHPAILLRHAKRRADWAVASSTLLVTIVGAMGAALYPAYRDHVRHALFTETRWVGFLFERKEHLAFGAIVLTWSGAIAYAAAIRADETMRATLRTFAFRAYVAAATLAVVTASLGVIVAIYKTF